MSTVPIRISNFLGGVARVAQSLRLPFEFEDMENVVLEPVRGAQKRPGTQFIAGEGTRSELTVEDPTNTLHISWINRAEGERFVVVMDPDAADQDKVIQVFGLDGAEHAVEGDGDGDGSSNPLGNAENVDLRAYLDSGTGDLRRRLRALTVEDATFILNRTVEAGLKGGAITYRLVDTTKVRRRASDQNQAAWSDFDHPPTSVETPIQDLSGAGDITSDAIWYARDDDVGQPQGFYWAEFAEQPPWYTRVRTEGANSIVDEDTFPIRMDFDPDATPPFVVSKVDWVDRLAGDSTRNPGPSFIGNAISDLIFHQDRLFFLSGGGVVSSRAGDIFNMWVDSPILKNDADPIDQRVYGNRTGIIDFGFSFADALVILTRAARQVELRANGPLAPGTSFLADTTKVAGVEYARPTSLASQMYFLGQRDFANIVYQYAYDTSAFSNDAIEITERVQGYIPAEASVIVASEAHQQLFVLTDAETNAIYVGNPGMEVELSSAPNRHVLVPWYKWTFDNGNEILSIEVFDDFLYMMIRRDSRIYLERIPLGIPQQDTDDASGPIQTMGYNIPIDRKTAATGFYLTATDETQFVLDFEDSTIDELIFGPSWDQDSGDVQQRMAGVRFTGDGLTVTVGTNQTILVIAGKWDVNLLGDAAIAYAGRGFTKRITLSEQFFRDRDGSIIQGNLQLMTAVIRHRDTGYYALEVTPPGRSKLTKEFVPSFVGTTDFDGDILDAFGEFQPRVMTRSRGSLIEIVNDKPVPSSIVDMEFQAEFVPYAKSPTL